MKYKCLVVDDELAIGQATSEYLTMFDVPTAYVTDSASCLEFFKTNEASLLLLDINLGNESGFTLCKKLRETLDIPILFISARTDDDDVLTALNLGGDDYIKKPYSLSILLAKVKAVLRRYESGTTTSADPQQFRFGSVVMDYRSRRISVNDQPVHLKELEYKLLCYLVANKNRVLSKDEIFQNVWKDSFTGDGTLSVHIRHLREKLEENPNNPTYIKTIWGTGYMFEVLE